MDSSCYESESDLIREARQRFRDSLVTTPQQMSLGILTAENMELHAILQHPPNVLARMAFEQYLKAEKLKVILSKILKDRIDVLDLCKDILKEL